MGRDDVCRHFGVPIGTKWHENACCYDKLTALCDNSVHCNIISYSKHLSMIVVCYFNQLHTGLKKRKFFKEFIRF